jgi:hypothetical protein
VNMNVNTGGRRSGNGNSSTAGASAGMVVLMVDSIVAVVVVAEAFLGVRTPQNLRLNQHKLRSAR